MSNDTDHVTALVAFGKVGLELFAMRLLSLFALAGLIGLAFYVAWNQSWAGVVVTGIVGLCFLCAARLEGHRQPPG